MKTLKPLTFYQLYTKAWPTIQKLYVNLKQCEQGKNAIPIGLT